MRLGSVICPVCVLFAAVNGLTHPKSKYLVPKNVGAVLKGVTLAALQIRHVSALKDLPVDHELGIGELCDLSNVCALFAAVKGL